MKRSILIICRNTILERAPRFLIEVSALKKSYRLIVAGSSGDPQPEKDFEFIDLRNEYPIKTFYHAHQHQYPVFLKNSVLNFIKLLRKIYFRKNYNEQVLDHCYTVLDNFKYDLIIVHHLNDLPLAVRLAKKKNIPLIFNAHEYYPLEFDADENWMKTTHVHYMKIAGTYLKNVDLCFCVSPKIGEKYRDEFSLKSVIVTNAKPWYDLSPVILNPNEKIKLIHHGAALRPRKIELMIEIMEFLGDNYLLDFILVGDQDYINELKALSKPYSNIRFLEPVKTKDIPLFLNKYDIGLFILETTTFNYKFALPNKLFEFIQARLAIAIAPSPEMKEIVKKYDLGIVADNFTPTGMADKIKELSREKIMYFKNQSHLHSKELSAENNEILIKNVVTNMLEN